MGNSYFGKEKVKGYSLTKAQIISTHAAYIPLAGELIISSDLWVTIGDGATAIPALTWHLNLDLADYIDSLAAVSSLTGTEELITLQSGVLKSVTPNDIAALSGSSYYYYDLTSSAATHNLPDATTYIGELTIEAENGTVGGNNLSLNSVGSQTINGDADTVWKIEGSGTITLISNGSNWRVKDYIDTGTGTRFRWKKNADGTCSYKYWSYISGNATATISEALSIIAIFTEFTNTSSDFHGYKPTSVPTSIYDTTTHLSQVYTEIELDSLIAGTFYLTRGTSSFGTGNYFIFSLKLEGLWK